MTSFRRQPFGLFLGFFLLSSALVARAIRTCPDNFTFNVSASAYTQAVTPSWNLENALDTALASTTLDDIKAKGFRSVRIAVSFSSHYTSGSPSWSVDEKWLQRLSDVVEAVTSKGLYAIVSMHQDSIDWVDATKPGADMNTILEKFQQSWRHIGFLLTCNSDLVAFEVLNQPPVTATEHDGLISDLNNQFVIALAATGGRNSLRFVILLSPRTKGKWFLPPRFIVNPWAVQY